MSVTVTIEAHAKGKAPKVKPEEKQPVIVHCRDCGHEWAAFYFPLVMDAKGIRLMKSAAKACPMCAGNKIYMGPKNAAPQTGPDNAKATTWTEIAPKPDDAQGESAVSAAGSAATASTPR